MLNWNWNWNASEEFYLNFNLDSFKEVTGFSLVKRGNSCEIPKSMEKYFFFSMEKWFLNKLCCMPPIGLVWEYFPLGLSPSSSQGLRWHWLARSSLVLTSCCPEDRNDVSMLLNLLSNLHMLGKIKSLMSTKIQLTFFYSQNYKECGNPGLIGINGTTFLTS